MPLDRRRPSGLRPDHPERLRLRRSGRVFTAIAVGSAIGLAIACDFPNPTLVIQDPGPGVTEGGSNEAQADVNAPDVRDGGRDAERDVIQGIYDGAPDAIVIVKDAGNPVDASGCKVCDCDEDGFDRASCDGGTTPVKDCDDSDPRYAPDQGFLEITPAPGKTADWNCDGTVTPAFSANEVCAGLISVCNGREGFFGNPACGEEGRYVYCIAGGVLNLQCQVDEARSFFRKQACQ